MLDLKNTLFILNNSEYDQVITCDILIKLIGLNKVEIIKEIFNYCKIDLNSIINILFLYKNKTPISKNELQKIIDFNKKLLDINGIYNGENTLLRAVRRERVEIIKLILDYATKNNISLVLNNYIDNYPILLGVKNNNIEIVKLLMNYASKNNIILNINKRDGKYGYYPLIYATINNNTEMVKLLFDYASKNNIF